MAGDVPPPMKARESLKPSEEGGNMESGGEAGLELGEKEENGSAGSRLLDIGPGPRWELAQVAVEVAGSIGVGTVGMERWWKKRADGVWRLEDETNLGDEREAKWRMAVGVEEEQVTKIPRQEFPCGGYPGDESMIVTAAAAEQHR